MKRHPLDAVSLVFGITFAAIALLLLDTDNNVGDLSGPWIFPLPLLFLGLVLAAVGLSRISAPSQVAAEPTPTTAAAGPEAPEEVAGASTAEPPEPPRADSG